MIKSKNPSLTLVAVFECGCVWIRDRRLCDVVKKKKKKKPGSYYLPFYKP